MYMISWHLSIKYPWTGKRAITFNHLTSSSSSLCRAASTDILDPLSPLLLIVHRLLQVFRAISRILT